MSDRKLVDAKTGEELIVGQVVQTFRDENCTLIGIYEPGSSAGGNNGRVYLDLNGLQALYFPSVIRAKFVKVDNEPIEKLDTMRSVERQSWREKGYDD